MREKLLALLVPPFLRKLDRWLLLNHPRWWATKVHYVVFYGVIVNILAAFLGLVFFSIDLLSIFSSGGIWVFILLETGVFFFWLYKQSLYNVEQEYGNTRHAIGFVETIIYIICVLLIFSPSVVMMRTGIYKIAVEWGVNGNNICLRPELLTFYSKGGLDDLGNQYDVNKIHKAFELAGEAINSGTVTAENVFIQKDAVINRPAISRYLFQTGNSILLDYDLAAKAQERIKIDDGEAEIENIHGRIMIKHGITKTILEKGEKITVTVGDEISKYISSSLDAISSDLFQVVNGKIRVIYRYTIKRNQAFIVKKGNESELVMGEATVDSYLDNEASYSRGIWPFQYESPYRFCQYIKDPLRSYNNFPDYFTFPLILVFFILFTILGVFITLTLKYSNWLILMFSVIYILIQLVVLYIVALYIGSIFTSVISLLIFISSSLLMWVLFAIIQFVRSITGNKYNLITVINFMSLSIAFEFLISFLLASIWIALWVTFTPAERILTYDPVVYLTVILGIAFLICLLFTPLQKKLLIYFISLPRQ